VCRPLNSVVDGTIALSKPFTVTARPITGRAATGGFAVCAASSPIRVRKVTELGKSGNFFPFVELKSGKLFGVHKWMTNYRCGLRLIELGPCTWRRTVTLTRPIHVVAHFRGT
jgi:hypothetical protein